jgi:hypothetical protein
VVGRRSVAARIVEGTGSGVVADAERPEEIAAALERLVAGGRRAGGDRAAIDARYGYPALARQMAERVEVAIAGRRGRA